MKKTNNAKPSAKPLIAANRKDFINEDPIENNDNYWQEYLTRILNGESSYPILVPPTYSKEYIEAKADEAHSRILANIYRTISDGSHVVNYLEKERLKMLKLFFSLHDKAFLDIMALDDEYKLTKETSDAELLDYLHQKIVLMIKHPLSLYKAFPEVFVSTIYNHILYANLTYQYKHQDNLSGLLRLCLAAQAQVTKEMQNEQVFSSNSSNGLVTESEYMGDTFYPLIISDICRFSTYDIVRIANKLDILGSYK